MKRLIRENGLAMNKLKSLPGDVVTVYHGTGAQNIDNIKQNGLTENSDNSYQSNGASYGSGIWVTLNETAAKGYAIDSVNGFMKDNENSTDENITQYFNYGAIFSFEVSKNSLNDEGSASVNNLKSNETITSDKIIDIRVFDTQTNKEWVAKKDSNLLKTAYHSNNETAEWIEDRVDVLRDSNADMPESMAYGIAWQQYKKKHPGWKPKKSTAELSNAYKTEDSFGDDIQVETYTDPTSREISYCKENKYKAIRGVIVGNAECCWRGDILHHEIKGADVNEFRFAYENSPMYTGWTFDAHQKYTTNDMYKLIIEYSDKLSKYGNLNDQMYICYMSDNNDLEPINFNEIKELYNKVKEGKFAIKRLIKKGT